MSGSINGSLVWVALGLSALGAASATPKRLTESPQDTTAEEMHVADTRFHPDRGFYPNALHPERPVTVEIYTATPDADIYYTRDGSVPNPENGTRYTEPIPLLTTTVLRAAAFKEPLHPTNVDTHTYLFLSDVIRQENTQAGYPPVWAGHPADYEMDPDIVNDPRYADEIQQALRTFPSLSIACDPEALFGTKGLYQNPREDGASWERPVSAELIVPDHSEPGFQIDAGLRIQGGSSRNPDTPKHSFSLRFRKEYGAGKLDYPLFQASPYGDGAVERFDFLQLRSGYNFGWTHRHYYQARHAQYNRDPWTNDLYLAMGQRASHGRWVHLYLNGLYWGLYHLHERPDEDFVASYFGGEPNEYDVLNSGHATAGNKEAWNAMQALAQGNMADPIEYARVQQHVDIDSLIDYIILNCYIGNLDWDGHNWRAARRRVPGARFQFFPWDSEFAISPNGPGGKQNPAPLSNALHVDRSGVNGKGRPSGLHQRLTVSPEYRLRFEDRVHRHLYQNGALTPDRAAAAWTRRSNLMDRAIVAESARWGDFRRDVEAPSWPQTNFDLYTRDDHYQPDQAYILETYLPQRTGIVLTQFRMRRLYPTLDAPLFETPGGAVSLGHRLSLVNPNKAGVIYYTLDGTDPRRSHPAEFRTLLDTPAPARAFIPVDPALGTLWTGHDFDDSDWLSGKTGIGYERSAAGTYTPLIHLDVDPAHGRNATVYARIPFQIGDPTFLDEIRTLILNLKYDDGFFAYLNGKRIASMHAPERPSWYVQATASHPDSDALVFESFNVSDAMGTLRVGTNVLAIHLLNQSPTSSDLLAVPQLVASTPVLNPFSAGAIRYDGETVLTQTGPVLARVLDDRDWSALAKSFFIVGTPAAPGNLIISELFYNPPGPSEETEFIELMNISVDETIDLTGVRVGGGVRFDFAAGTTLAPAERLLLVADSLAFDAIYGADLPVTGQYTGNLSNSGETIQLMGHDGTPIETVSYDDKNPWPEEADGRGFSLVRIAPEWNRPAQSPASWTRSGDLGGSPGFAEGASVE